MGEAIQISQAFYQIAAVYRQSAITAGVQHIAIQDVGASKRYGSIKHPRASRRGCLGIYPAIGSAIARASANDTELRHYWSVVN